MCQHVLLCVLSFAVRAKLNTILNKLVNKEIKSVYLLVCLLSAIRIWKSVMLLTN